jgi:hypothetical protein
VCVYTATYHAVKKQDYEFVQAGRGTTIASLLPLKTLAIGGATRPDQFGVPALGY